MHLDLHGQALAREIGVDEVGREVQGAFALFAGGQGLHQVLEVFQGLAVAEVHLEVLGADAFHRLAVLERGEVQHHHVAVTAGARFGHRHQFGHVGADAGDDLVHFLLVHHGLFLLHGEAVVVGQVELGQHFKGNVVLEGGAALQLPAIEVDARDGVGVEGGHHFVDMHVHEVLGGLVVDFLAEAALDQARGHLALAEPVKGHVGAVHGDGRGQGGLHLFDRHRDVDLFLDRGKIFDGIFHGATLLVNVCSWPGRAPREGAAALVPGAGIEPAWCEPLASKTSAYTSSATPAVRRRNPRPRRPAECPDVAVHRHGAVRRRFGDASESPLLYHL